MNVGSAFYFLVDTLFDVYIYFVIARFILQMVRADFYNPLSQIVVKVTSPLLMPLRRMIPGFGRVDVACIVLLLIVVLIKLLVVISLFGSSAMFAPLYFVALLVKTVAASIINFFWFVIIVSVILSWVAMGTGHNPTFDVIRQLSDPVIQPVRQIVPPLGMFDLSPMIVLFILYFIKILFGL